MVFIKKDSSNYFILRLADKRTLSNSYFLWELTNIFNQEVVYFLLDDTSLVQCDYNLFNLIESPTGSKVGGVNVPLDLISGQYEYKLFETTTPDLNLSSIIGDYIEKDMLVVELDKNVNTSTSDINDIYN